MRTMNIILKLIIIYYIVYTILNFNKTRVLSISASKRKGLPKKKNQTVCRPLLTGTKNNREKHHSQLSVNISP